MRVLTCAALILALNIALVGCGGKTGSRGPAGMAPVSDGAPKLATKMVAEGGDHGPDAAEKAPERVRPQQSIPAGQLTAGSFDDNLNLPIFHAFLRKLGQDPAVSSLSGRFQGRHLTITVRNEAGQPVHNARVRLQAGSSSVELPSRPDGRAIFVMPWDGLPTDSNWSVSVTAGSVQATEKIPRAAVQHTLVLQQVSAAQVQGLDLALVIDATGSMGDEMEYVKAEMKWIAGAIHAKFPHVQQRYALIVYRDEGDQYVTRTFPFTESLDELRRNLQAQSAGGGGDYPEAVHRALEDATQLAWRTDKTARVLVHLADAPPHTPDFERALKAVDQLRKTGVAIYPVAASGYDPACEFLMRTSALLTGGQFLFLTDDSGIGHSHAEPNINAYHVERLNSLLVRMIVSELSGRRIDPLPQDIIRTVGKVGALGQQR